MKNKSKVDLAVTTPIGQLEPVYTLDESATTLVSSVKTLRREIKAGNLGCIRVGRNIRILERHLREYIERNEQKPDEARRAAKDAIKRIAG